MIIRLNPLLNGLCGRNRLFRLAASYPLAGPAAARGWAFR
jgi:hypothetical protein